MSLMLLFDELRVDLCYIMLDLQEYMINLCFWNHWNFLENFAWGSWNLHAVHKVWTLPADLAATFISLAAEFPADFFELPADSHALHGLQALGFKAGRRRFGLAPWDVWNWHVFDSPFRPKSIGLVLFFMWYLACSCIAYHAFVIFSSTFKN